MVKAAAILLEDGSIYTGKNHSEIIGICVKNGCKTPVIGVQGFVNDKGTFLTREEAAIEAITCGQIVELKYHSKRLFSEELIYDERTCSYQPPKVS